MDLGGYSLAGWLGFIVAMLFAAYVLFVPVYCAELMLWTALPPRRGSRYNKDNMWVGTHKVLVGSILFVVATVITIQLAQGVIKMSSSPSYP